ncbi:MAG: putative porin [Bacteroidia bacterium]|nr:putative porin [Bacteroidia bacterium]
MAGGKIPELTPLKVRLDNFQFNGYRHLALGNLGAPSLLLQLPGVPFDAFRRSNNSFAFFGYSDANRVFYTSKKPYTSIRVVVGQRRASETEVLHAHNFGPNCNITFGFLRQRAEGFYNRQNTNNTSARLNGWYWSAANRYALTGDFYWTGHDALENGGIRSLSSFENAQQLDRRLVAVNLFDAENKQRVRSGRVKQYFAFGSVIDTLVFRGDSLDERDTVKIKHVIRPRAAITHTLQFKDESWRFTSGSSDTAFYQTDYRDTLETLDSTGLWRLSNSVAFEIFPAWKESIFPFSGSFGIRHEFGRLRNDTIRHDFQNIFAEAMIRLADKKSALLRTLEANAWLVAAGENSGDFKISAIAADRTILWKHWVLQAAADVSLTRPVFMTRHFSGNHFRWANNFTKEGVLRAGASAMYGTKNYSWVQLALDFYNYDRPVYYNASSLPAQLNGSVQALQLTLSHLLHLKSFHWRGSAVWTQLPDAAVIRLPEFILRQSFYFEFRLFKRALQMQAGVDAEWFSGYFAQAYNPNLSQFYLQDSQEIGNYLYLDPWISIRIRPVRVFVKADHVNAGLFGRRYYIAPSYPHNDLALRLGISWIFND